MSCVCGGSRAACNGSIRVKLLFDENLSPRLVGLVSDVFPGSTHVRDVGMKAASDPIVWNFAAEHGYVIVSKDADFRQRSILLGPPPKVIGLLMGNCPTGRVESVLRSNVSVIGEFERDQTAAFLELP